MKQLFLSAVAVAAPIVAHAADLNSYKDAPFSTPAPYWTGFHAGAGAGIFWGQASTGASTDIAFADCEGSCQAYSHSGSDNPPGSGAFGSIEAGYDYQLTAFVLGVGANFDFKDKTRASVSFNGYDNQTPPDTSSQQVDVEFGNSFAIYARAGLLVTPGTLLYGLAGYANQQVNLSSAVQAGNTGSLRVVDQFSTLSGFSTSSNKDGWTAGAGLEQLLGGGFSIKAEYRYADFGKLSAGESFSSTNCSFCTYTLTSRASADLSTQSLRVLLSYRF